jgi:hypothetical protein
MVKAKKISSRRKAWLIAIIIQVIFIACFIAALFTLGAIAGGIIRPGHKDFAVKCGAAGSGLAAIYVLILYLRKKISQ